MKNNLVDRINDHLAEAQTAAGAGHGGIAKLDELLPWVAYDRDQILELEKNDKPFKRMPMSTYAPDEDETPLSEHRRKLAWGVRQIEGHLRAAEQRAANLREHFSPLFAFGNDPKNK
jgi:hypothetical protein